MELRVGEEHYIWIENKILLVQIISFQPGRITVSGILPPHPEPRLFGIPKRNIHWRIKQAKLRRTALGKILWS